MIQFLMALSQSETGEDRQLGSKLRYKALDEVANSHTASSHTTWYLDLDFIYQ